MLEKEGKECFIVDIDCPFETRVAENERVEMQKVSVIPIAIGSLGTVSKHLRTWISKKGTPGIIALLHKACLLETTKILRRTLNT